jgi:F-type H+-transporting ATPase subunit b
MGLLTPHTGTLIWMLISFLTVFLILKKFAWKPLLNALKLREDTISRALKSAEEAKKEMEKITGDKEALIADAKKERDKIIREARDLKDSILIEAKNQAGIEAEKIIDASKNSIKAEKENAIKEIREHAASLSIFIAEKLLKEKLVDESDQKELIDKLLRDIKTN